MNLKKHITRRRVERVGPLRTQVALARRAGAPLRRASVADVSTRGIGLVVDAHDLPAVGDKVSVIIPHAELPCRATVVRTTNLPGDRSHLGCSWFGPGPALPIGRLAGEPAVFRRQPLPQE